MAQNSNLEDNEIDLQELFGALWSHKFLIAFFTALSIFLSGYYFLNAEKKFTASATFQIEEKNANSGFNLLDGLGPLASIAAFSSMGQGSNSATLLERAVGREFIIDMNEKASLYLDPYFNNYDPNYTDPLWKATIKKIIGWQKTEREKNAIVEYNVTKNYRENVGFDKTDAGATIVSVTHIDPNKAADYANVFMEEIRKLVKGESLAAQSLKLDYLSKTLADALQEMEKTQEDLKNYALKNSALAQENFISDSLKLDQIRMEKRKVTEIADLLSLIEILIKSGNLDDSSYEAIRSNNPLIDDIDFRRILGMSETISERAWPEVETIKAVSATLRDRIKRLDIDIKNIEENATIYATSAEDLAKFKRAAKIAEATYTVLIEHVKTETLAAGFKPDTFKVFEYATPPLSPSSPKRNLVLALGALLGIFAGISFTLINSRRTGVYYTRSALLSDTSAELALRSKSIKHISGKSIPEIISSISKRRIVALDEVTLNFSSKKIIYVLNSGGRISSSDTARLLATQSAQSGRNVVLCDTTGQSEKALENKSSTHIPDLPVVNISNNVNVLKGSGESNFFTSTKFNSKIKDLTSHFDQIFVCSSNKNGQLGLMALAEFTPCLILISGLRKTRKFDIKNIKTKQPVDILFYD